MRSIKSFLDDLKPLNPLVTGEKPDLKSGSGKFKAVIFDIYGTLLISASGDIDKTTLSSESMVKALKACDIQVTGSEAKLAKTIPLYKETISELQAVIKSDERSHPEIDIREVWHKLLKKFQDTGIITGMRNEVDIDRAAFIFEVLSNRVYPMPNMTEVISGLHGLDLKLGIVSNAQFYTPVIMNYFITGKVEMNEQISYFDPALTVYSYQERCSKPDVKLYEIMADRLYREYGIEAGDAIFIGNDMYKDVYAAAAAGFKTVLYAGDMRSLRLRDDQPEVKGVKPDYTITELSQIMDII